MKSRLKAVWHPDWRTEGERSTEPAAIAAEVCTRLAEWRDCASESQVSAWLLRLVALYHAHPQALWSYVEWQGADLAVISKSYDDRAKADARSRQAVQQERERVFAAINRVSPELAHAMRETYEAVSPEAHAERYRQAT